MSDITHEDHTSEQLPLNDPNSLESDRFPPFEKTIHIAVTGDVRVTPLELDIINTPDFQRLRGVRQLGSAVLVYPTALHTRFDHSLGTLGMVERMIAEIRDDSNQYQRDYPEECKIDDKQREIARLYALLHDITHVPFGHTLEDELQIFPSHDNVEKNDRFEKLLGPKSPIGSLITKRLGEDGYARFRSLFFLGSKKSESEPGDAKPDVRTETIRGDAFIYDLVSNTVCADLLDYVMRDSYFCSLGIDFEYRFLKYLFISTVGGERRVVVRLWKRNSGVPRRDVLTDLTRLLRARYMIAERVYFHHAKIVAGTMIGRAVFEARERKLLNVVKLCDYSDDTLVDYLTKEKEAGEICNKLARAYKERTLHKVADAYPVEYFARLTANPEGGNPRDKVIKALSKATTRCMVEDHIAEDIGAQQGQVLIYVPELKMNKKVAAMLVQWNGETIPFEKVDDQSVRGALRAVLDSHDRLWTVYLLTDPQIFEEKKVLAQHSFEEKIAAIIQHKKWEEHRTEHVAHIIRYKVGLLSIQGKALPSEYPPDTYESKVVDTAQKYAAAPYRAKSGSDRVSLNKIIKDNWSGD